MKKAKVILMARYFPSLCGGGEKSIFEELKTYQQQGHSVRVISFDDRYSLGDFSIDGIKGTNYKLSNVVPFDRYRIVLSNQKYILSVLSKFTRSEEDWCSSDLVLIQGTFAHIFAQFCIGRNMQYHYYLRDQNSLNEFHNYRQGYRNFLHSLKYSLQFVPRIVYSKKNVVALQNANLIIANSQFIQNLLLKKYSLNSKLIYPKVDYSKLSIKKIKKKYIGFVGNYYPKGFDIILRIAKKLPDREFLVVDRAYKNKFQMENITYLPYQKDINDFYSQVSLLLVPSRWQEAFGRIVLEAQYLGIPVLVSNRGGLPEAIKDKDNIIKELENVDVWVKKIKEVQK